MSSSVLSSTTTSHVSQREAQLPVELLHIIVSHVVSEYLDDLIAGPLALPAANIDLMTAEQAGGDHADVVVQVLPPVLPPPANGTAAGTAGPGWPATISLRADPDLEKGNPLISLLRTGAKIRATTLKVLSDVLDIELVDDGIQRLKSKPWARIQLVRHLYANAFLFHRLRREHNFREIMCSSGLIATYTLLSVNGAQLQLAKRKMGDARHDSAIAAFGDARGLICQLFDSLCTIQTGPLMIKNDIVRVKMSYRTEVWAIDMANFVAFKVCLRICGAVFRLIRAAEDIGEQCQGVLAGVNAERVQETISEAYDTLLDILKMFQTIASAMKSVLPGHLPEFASAEEVASARETLLVVMRHTGREGLNYGRCQTCAKEVCDWLDVTYGVEIPGEVGAGSSS
ncbi:hypothetical protein BC835DRAFT_1303793 [Cytidiella melzeri]|nr:hypothetical protein BC835DRAFT_1303793 [Cytidiella melzeri]